jgi:hypothetical protein
MRTANGRLENTNREWTPKRWAIATGKMRFWIEHVIEEHRPLARLQRWASLIGQPRARRLALGYKYSPATRVSRPRKRGSAPRVLPLSA